jgi:hypothetical protein
LRALANHITFKFSQGGEKVKHQASLRRGRVNRIIQTLDTNIMLQQQVDGLNQMLERTPQSIQLPHHHYVARSHFIE